MDKFSFLNAAHTQFFADLYDQYLENPDSIEPSWRAFFQGFDFGQNGGFGTSDLVDDPEAFCEPQLENLEKEFKVIKLIEGYRKRGHLFTLTNPVRERRKYEPALDIENFGLSEVDMDTVFNAGELIGIGTTTLKNIISHLKKVYCQSIGVEYNYVRNPKEQQWIQNWIHKNDNQPNLSPEQKKYTLKKLNEAVTFESLLHTK